jgi:uncharacterized membrane protein
VAVQPLVVLSGWFVEQGKGNFNVKAMNANYLAGFLRREDEKLEAAQVRRIIAALDEKCRNDYFDFLFFQCSISICVVENVTGSL